MKHMEAQQPTKEIYNLPIIVYKIVFRTFPIIIIVCQPISCLLLIVVNNHRKVQNNKRALIKDAAVFGGKIS